MKIKSKLQLGFFLLFMLTLTIGVLATYYLNRISVDTNAVLKDNYESLQYTHNMSNAIKNDPIQLTESEIKSFERNLKAQENNITEAGEAEQTTIIRDQYNLLHTRKLKQDQIIQAKKSIKTALKSIEDVNMQAIYRKYQTALNTSKKATIYVSFITVLCLLIGFSFIVNFPGYIANPIRELSEGIKAISNKNYKQRLEFHSKGEFSDLAQAFNDMAAKLNEWENSSLATIKSEKLRIEAIIGQMQDAIIGLNEEQEILFINTVAEQLMNLKGQQVVGQNAFELIKKNDLLKNVLENERTDQSFKIYANGKESYFQLESREIIVPIPDEKRDHALTKTGKSAGKVYILRNITQFKELDQAKTNFIATVSHELKTPLSSIKMSLKLLNDERIGSMNDEQKELVNHIKEDSDRLLKITSELLDLSQVETGNLQLNYAPADPNEIVNYAIDTVKFQAEQKGIILEVISRQKLPKVYADIEKTAWVLVNFLSNAFRYSPEKSKVIIEIIEKGNAVEFSVKDFGKGIDEQYQKRLFDRYFQVPTDGKNKSGSGLGLAISKDFIEAQQGHIFLESEVGVGSRFGFQLPVAF